MVSSTIISTKSSERSQHIHSRMPALFLRSNMDEWIDCSHPQAEVLQLLKPYSQAVAYYPVSTFVNIPLNNSPKCIEPMIIEE